MWVGIMTICFVNLQGSSCETRTAVFPSEVSCSEENAEFLGQIYARTDLEGMSTCVKLEDSEEA